MPISLDSLHAGHSAASTPTKTTYGLSTESTYDWESEKWTVPVNFTVNQLLKFGDQIVQVGVM